MVNIHWVKARTLISGLRASGWYWVYPLIFLLSLLPMLVYGENAYIVIHDNLDSMVSLRLALVNSGQLLNFHADAQVDELLFAFLNLFSERSSNFNYVLLIVLPFYYSMLFVSLPHAIAILAGRIGVNGNKRSKVPCRDVKTLPKYRRWRRWLVGSLSLATICVLSNGVYFGKGLTLSRIFG